MDDYMKLTFKLDPFEPWSDVLAYELGLIQFESFEQEEDGLLAYVQEKYYDEQKVYNIIYELSVSTKIEFTARRLEKKNWNKVWEENYPPILIAEQLFVRAHFHEPDPNADMEILLTPKMSFGTGHHATTQLMIEKMFSMDLKDAEVADIGTGTGILAILAEKRGAKSVFAIDIDQWSVDNALENIEINNCHNITVEKGEIQDVDLKTYSTILANINLNVILDDLKVYAEGLQTEGDLILSGFLTSDTDKIIDVAKAHGLVFASKADKNEWSMLHLKKK